MMGMYTQLVCGLTLRKDVDPDVIHNLHYLYGDYEYPVPDSHPLFTKDNRRLMLLRCDSHYFSWDTKTQINYDDISERWTVTIVTNLKNYDQEIEDFLDWIAPHLGEYHDSFLGFKRYEEAEHPTLIYLTDGIEYVEVGGSL